MTQKNQQAVDHAGLSNQRVVVLGGSSGIGLFPLSHQVSRWLVQPGPRYSTQGLKMGRNGR